MGLDLNLFVAGMVAALRRQVGPGTELMTGFAAGLPAVRADPRELERTLSGLVSASMRSLPGGGRLLLMTGRSAVGAFLRVEDAAGGTGVTVSLPAA